MFQGLFKKPQNELESYSKPLKTAQPSIPDEMCVSCPKCKQTLFISDLNDNFNICPKCKHHFKINARQRIHLITDENSFAEFYSELSSKNLIDFPDYEKKAYKCKFRK